MLTLSTVTLGVERERLQLDFFIPGVAWQGLYDSFEVWRSPVSAQGPYQPLHYNVWFPAQLPAANPPNPQVPPAPPNSGPGAAIAGLQLLLLVNETIPVSVTFTGTNPITYGQAALQVAAQSLGLLNAFVAADDITFIVQTAQVGIYATLQCTGGDAAPLLGLSATGPSSLAFGLNPRIPLVFGQELYTLVDPYGSPQYFYKTRFYNSLTTEFSDFSFPVQQPPLIGVAPTNLCRGYVQLVDLTGAPAANREVLITSEFNGTQVENAVVTGGNRRLLTDRYGCAELPLVRGTQVTVGIEGTTIARDVTIPTDPAVQSLNLLSSANGQNDVFTVQVPSIPYAVRRTL